ncbi:hypothetical protein [Nonomuraea basaltis]|uniref:hypothetical protein n=1 Tax=Nonomuraea basaltis TaxID=2495887 RepID=UPI00110C6009|nr:hypothetical protein [Nonomuraea basaltis]TMR99563.1 hypothetical protein EJK15_07050 [Nonomuraea basaltis]
MITICEIDVDDIWAVWHACWYCCDKYATQKDPAVPKPPHRTADVELLHRLRTRQDELLPEMSFKAVADKIAQAAGYNFYPNKVRRIESGETRASDLDYAWVTWAVGGSVSQVEEVGRPEAARLLRDIIAKHSATDTKRSSLDPSITPQHIQAELQEKLREIRSMPGITDEERANMEETLLQHLDLVLRTYDQQIQMLRVR